MDKLFLDIETYSSADLKKTGVYPYSEDPEFQILMVAYALNGDPVSLTEDADEIVHYITDPNIIKVAHNAQFERVCFSRYLHSSPDVFLDPGQWEDTAALAAANGAPRSLDPLGIFLGGEKKDTAGTRLINKFCVPNRSGERNSPEDYPEDWEAFKDYCVQDVVTLRDVYHKLPALVPEEKTLFYVDQQINDYGLLADVETAEYAVAADEENRRVASEETRKLLGIENPSSIPQMLQGLEDVGVSMPDLRAATVKEKLEEEDLPEVGRKALENRQTLALSAAKKYQAILHTASTDNRVRGAFMYHGAHTGRWAGRGVQLQNLPRAQVRHPDAAILDLNMGFGASPQTLKSLVRAMFVGPFVVADFSAIEARVLAWIAGEDWVLEAFNDGRDIYVETAKKMSTEAKEYTRFDGKTAVLALGYQGSINSLRIMGADGTDQQLFEIVNNWRSANQNIVRFWYSLEEAFVKGGPVGNVNIWVSNTGDTRYIYLPSGRNITYHKVQVTQDSSGRRKVSFLDHRGNRTDTYGGKLTENVTQAIARDLLGNGLIKLAASNYKTVGHVHDEVIVESEDVDGVVKAMTDNPEWALDLPLDAEGFTCKRYRKG